jgi:hypothetical protein
MLLSSLLLVPSIAHAATGQVNVNGGAQIVSLGTDTTVSVPINIAGSDPLNGFDIQVLADPTILSGASVSLVGSVITSPTIVIECINGILVAGSTCAPQDGAGVVHLAAAHVGSLTAGNGLLFTINYNIVGSSAGTPISFNTGCSGTSVLGDCVTISNGTPTAVSETDLGATYANLNDFTITPAFAQISTPASVVISDVINYVAKGTFSDTLSETVTGPCTLATNSVNLAFFPTGSDTLSCMSATNGNFPVTVTATGSGTGVTHSASITLHVGPAGFSSAVKPTSISIPQGGSDSSAVVTLTGVSGFSGAVSVTATGPAGITTSASPSMVSLTNDGSGYSTGTSTLTVNVANSVPTGTYGLAVTGGSTLSVIVKALDFTIGSLPSAESVPRGGAAVATISLVSVGGFAGTVTLTAVFTTQGLDPGTGTNNLVATFLPATVTLTAGSSGATGFSASTVKIGTSPNAANTATGNYTATITATSGSISHITTIVFNVFDFSLGPNYCAGSSKEIFTTPTTFFDPVFVGEQCNTFTLTTQTVAQGGAQATLWMQVNGLGGIQTHGAASTGVIAAVNPTGPGRGSFVPGLGRSVCFFDTFFANGTQLSRSYIRANGPVVRAGPFGGCRFSFAYAVPNDNDVPICVAPDNPSLFDCVNQNNVDFYAITADALSTTLPGTYFVNVCGLIGTLLNCQMVTLIVITPPVVHQFVYSHSVSISGGGVQSFKLGITNNGAQTIWVQDTVTATGSLGHTFTATTIVAKVNPFANANNLVASIQLTKADVGETFTFTSSILVSAVDPGAVAIDPLNGTTSSGTSTLQSITATFTVFA